VKCSCCSYNEAEDKLSTLTHTSIKSWNSGITRYCPASRRITAADTHGLGPGTTGLAGSSGRRSRRRRWNSVAGQLSYGAARDRALRAVNAATSARCSTGQVEISALFDTEDRTDADRCPAALIPGDLSWAASLPAVRYTISTHRGS